MKKATIFKLNSVAFIATAASCYQGAMKGMPWLGYAAFFIHVILFLPLTELKQKRLLLAIIVGAVGLMMDTGLYLTGVYSVKDSTRWVLPAPFCPDWIFVLWLNFGFMLYIYWLMLRRSYVIGSVIGIIFAIIIYGNAERNGLLLLKSPLIVSLSIIAFLWALAIPVFTKIAIKFYAGGPIHETIQ